MHGQEIETTRKCIGMGGFPSWGGADGGGLMGADGFIPRELV